MGLAQVDRTAWLPLGAWHLDGRIHRYDNFPDTNWAGVSTFPFHFHDGDQDTVVAAPFAQTLEQGFREFMTFVQRMMSV